MSYRRVDQDAIELFRSLQDQINEIKKSQGVSKMNTVRLSDWVLEAVDDSLVKMTNIVTGEESYIGGVGGNSTAIVGELPIFGFGGVIRKSFSQPLRTNTYFVRGGGTVGIVDVTLTELDTGAGPIVQIVINDTVAWTSPRITENVMSFTDANIILSEGDEVRAQISDDGAGYGLGLSVMLRLV